MTSWSFEVAGGQAKGNCYPSVNESDLASKRGGLELAGLALHHLHCFTCCDSEFKQFVGFLRLRLVLRGSVSGAKLQDLGQTFSCS